MANTPTREHREAAIRLCYGNPTRCCKDWAEFETAPELHTAAVRIAQALADTDQRGYERGREAERAELVSWLEKWPEFLSLSVAITHIKNGQHLAKEE